MCVLLMWTLTSWVGLLMEPNFTCIILAVSSNWVNVVPQCLLLFICTHYINNNPPNFKILILSLELDWIRLSIWLENHIKGIKYLQFLTFCNGFFQSK